MDQGEFEHGLDRYGGDLDAWPPGLRAAADALLARSAAAQQAQRAARLVERVLAATRPQPGETATPAARLAARASQARQDRPAARAFLRVGLAAGFACTLLAGMLLGGSLPVGGSFLAGGSSLAQGGTMPDDAPDPMLRTAFSTTETPDVD